MRLLVLGKTGQVATELARLQPNAVFLGRDEADLSCPEEASEALARAITVHSADAVINAAAYTAVDRAEEEEQLALKVNGLAPTEFAKTCKNAGVPLVHISTDYVFDGRGSEPFHPDTETAPIGAYGSSKLIGESGVRAAGGVHAVLRTSWVFSAHGANFVKTMMRLSETRDTLRIVSDQVGGPTPASSIAEACMRIAQTLCEEPSSSGTYHFSGAPDVSWAEFATEIFRLSGRTVQVEPIATHEYPTPAQRPLNSRLDCSVTAEVFGVTRPDWRIGLAAVLKELGFGKRTAS